MEIGDKFILEDQKEYLLLRKIEDEGMMYAALVTTQKPNIFLFTKMLEKDGEISFVPVSGQEKMHVLMLFQN